MSHLPVPPPESEEETPRRGLTLERMVRMKDPVAGWVETEARRRGISHAAFIVNTLRDAMIKSMTHEPAEAQP